VIAKEYFDWKNYKRQAKRGGIKVFKDFDLGTRQNISTGGHCFIAGKCPKIPGCFTDKILGTEATRLHEDAKNWLRK
jgi:hypothetical protein